MKNIAVLIDYTEGSAAAIQQAAGLAALTGGTVFGIHVISAGAKVAEEEQKLDTFLGQNVPAEVHKKAVLSEGNLASATYTALKKIDADLVVICTHGIKGMMQRLFGAHILKLVQALPYPCMVIQENCNHQLHEIKKILFPIGPHPDFMHKIKQTAAIARMLNATVHIYEIDRPGSDMDNMLLKNAEASKEYFEEHGISYVRILDELQVLSIGYSRQTIDYATQNGFTMIALMATVSRNDILSGYLDKENFLVNDMGISVLSCNC